MGGVKKPQAQLADDQLFQFLYGLVDQVEADSGTEETDLKAKIAALQAETRKTPGASTSRMSEVDVARELDNMSAKLDSLGALVEEATADSEVQGLLANSANLWVPVITASAEERTAKTSAEGNSDTTQT
ncbi:uncharacterized protein [Physcomitrium patens]|uniref:Uncharacterized protein n=1 Tax=Physcomitrium patens TaxID=3218 RepID=A9SCC7_PHYPA|nr:uncharacterized protein LOC112294555 [Physcomitrium patens]PNR36455.1 hypothetical protein PHYPA_022306 [Physcomitrium patens]|eukprot:XP_024400898.1 uncharacterized protein LOC112294555 [Physcomitrella patens]